MRETSQKGIKGAFSAIKEKIPKQMKDLGKNTGNFLLMTSLLPLTTLLSKGKAKGAFKKIPIQDAEKLMLLRAMFRRRSLFTTLGEILMIAAIFSALGGNWWLAVLLGIIGLGTLTIYTLDPFLALSPLPLCVAGYYLWFGPIPTLVGAGLIAFFPLLLIIVIYYALTHTTKKSVAILVAIILTPIILIFLNPGNVIWTPGYPEWVPVLGGKTPYTLFPQLMRTHVPSPFVNYFPLELISWLMGVLVVIAIYHAAYSATLTSPTLPPQAGGGASPLAALVGNFFLAVGIFIILGINWISIVEAGAGRLDYIQCVVTNMLTPQSWMATGMTPWEYCKRIKGEEKLILHKFGREEILSVRLGTEELEYKVFGFMPGEEYVLWFTVYNLRSGEKELPVEKILVSQPLYNHTNLKIEVKEGKVYVNNEEVDILGYTIYDETGREIQPYYADEHEGWYLDYNPYHGKQVYVYREISECDWFKKNVLKPRENKCNAVVFMPKELGTYKPKVVIIWNQTVEARDILRVVSSPHYYQRNYRPVCIEERGMSYACPTVSEGPVNLVINFVPRQYLSGSKMKIHLLVGVGNVGKGKVTRIEAKKLKPLGITLPSRCEEKISSRINTIDWEKLKGEKAGLLTECTFLPSEIGISLKEGEPYKETLVSMEMSYTYAETFELPKIETTVTS